MQVAIGADRSGRVRRVLCRREERRLVLGNDGDLDRKSVV